MLIDSHAHLDMDDFEKDRDEVIERAVKGGIDTIISIGIDLKSSEKALALANEYSFIFSSVGFHPHDADVCTSDDLETLANLACDSNVVAWGEIGLDFFRLHSSPESQLKAFSRQLKTAHDLHLPVIIHDRDAHRQTYDMLAKMGKGKGVIHCFSGDLDLAMAFIDLGYYISIPGTVTYKKASKIKKVAAQVPLEAMLVETDSPFLAPVPKRGKRNEPLFVTYTVQEIARLRDMNIEEVAKTTSRNAKTLFAIPEKRNQDMTGDSGQ